MLFDCLSCRTNKQKNPKVLKKNKGKIMLSSKYEVCDGKKSKFIKTTKTKNKQTKKTNKLMDYYGA